MVQSSGVRQSENKEYLLYVNYHMKMTFKGKMLYKFYKYGSFGHILTGGFITVHEVTFASDTQ